MHNDRTRRQGEDMTILVRNNIKFDILETCSSIDTDYEAITILIKDLQISTNISTIFILSSNLCIFKSLSFTFNYINKIN